MAERDISLTFILMSTKLYVGNLPWSIDSQRLEEIFSEFGTVEDAFVLTDRETRRSRGFGFVTFSSEEEANAAIEAMHGKDLEGRDLVVNVAKPREERF